MIQNLNKAAYQIVYNYNLGNQIQKITAKTLVMAGENDFGSAPRVAPVIR